jgi:hypothetical protein
MDREKFYLGRIFDFDKGESTTEDLYYDSDDLVTHGVVLGMTGSGKTGLSVILLEEAALSGIPTIIIDPKGDMTNLLLAFPDYRPSDFLPWIDPAEAKKEGEGVEEVAKKTASLWKNGHGEWGISGERVKKFRESCDFTVFTPGSSASVPVNILNSFKIPKEGGKDDERIKDLISGSASALLSLVGIEADPIKSREHILLSVIWEEAWQRGQDLNLEKIITFIADPPMKRVGVFDLETFYPKSERFELAMALNNIIASPTFEAWRKGPPLSIDFFIRPKSKPGASIFYLAHLSEKERHFFITMLLWNLVSWMKGQEGTSKLRLLVYIDEALGMLPPHPQDPPTKKPILTILKQARAFGVGLLVATQNPVDLDYKALTNAGSWFIGRLQTKRDKERLLEGLTYASGAGPDPSKLDDIISGLEKRAFLLHNVHEGKPAIFKTRWAMSYLRGPVSKDRLKELPKSGVGDEVMKVSPEAVDKGAAVPDDLLPAAPDSGMENYFLSPRSSAYNVFSSLIPKKETEADRGFRFVPAVFARADAKFDIEKGDKSHKKEIIKALFPISDVTMRWDESMSLSEGSEVEREVSVATQNILGYQPLPEWLKGAKSSLSTDFVNYLYSGEKATLLKNPHFDLFSDFGEKKEDFISRILETAEDKAAEEVEKITEKYKKKIESIEKKIKQEQRDLSMREMEYEDRKKEELLSIGETAIGLVFGRKRTTGLSSAVTKRRMTKKAKGMMEGIEAELLEFKKEMDDLSAELEEEVEKIEEEAKERAGVTEEVEVSLEKNDIFLKDFGILWIPV